MTIYQLPILGILIHVICFLLKKIFFWWHFFIINNIVRQALHNVMHCLIFTNILTYIRYKVEAHHDTINTIGVCTQTCLKVAKMWSLICGHTSHMYMVRVQNDTQLYTMWFLVNTQYLKAVTRWGIYKSQACPYTSYMFSWTCEIQLSNSQSDDLTCQSSIR